MPHLEEQFPPVNPLVLQRPDALDPPDREEEEIGPARNRTRDELPLPGSLADGIDRVTISASARVIVPAQPNGETVPLPADLTPGAIEVNPAVPELLDIEAERRDLGADAPETDEIISASLQNFLNVLETRRRADASSARTDLSPIESQAASTSTTPTSSTPPAAPTFTPATPLAQSAVREAAPEIRDPITVEPSPSPTTAPQAPTPTANQTELEQNEGAASINENRFVPVAPPPRGPLSVEPDNVVVPEPAEVTPNENTLGIRGDTPIPRTEGRVNILTPPTVGEEPPGINIKETRNLGQGRTLSLSLDTEANDDTFVALDTIDEALEEAGAIVGPDSPTTQAETLPPVTASSGLNATPIITDTPAGSPNPSFSPTALEPRNLNALRDPADIPGPEGRAVETSVLVDTQQVFEEDQEAQALQPPPFPEIDPDEPFAPLLQPEAREEDVPAVAQAPLNTPPPAFENVASPVAPPVPGNVEAINESPQALRGDNLGTDPALRGNRELRNFLQDFNNRIEPPAEVIDDEGAPVAEVQNNAPPPPPVFENLEAESAELLDRVRERQATEGVTRPEEEHTAPPEPRTPESVLTGRGQNIDRFI